MNTFINKIHSFQEAMMPSNPRWGVDGDKLYSQRMGPGN